MMQTQKPYKVRFSAGAPNFDSAPVAKITDYPLEPRDYRPFAQCILCASERELHLRMWAFEVSPMPTSAIGCVLYLYPGDPRQALTLWVRHGEENRADTDVRLLHAAPDQAGGPETVVSTPFGGEDLQGVYWGRTITLPVEQIERMGGPAALKPGARFPGNFYKTCADGRFAHSGSLFPAAFPHDPFGGDSMGEFEIIGY